MKLIRDRGKHAITDGGNNACKNQKVKNINAFVRFYSLFLVNLLNEKIGYM